MKVALIFPDQIYVDKIPFKYKEILIKKRPKKRIAPIGLFMLKDSIKDEVFFLDNYKEGLKSKDVANWCLKRIGKNGIVGFGGDCTGNPQAVKIAQILKNMSSDIITIYGGPNATVRPEKHVNDFDYVFRGHNINGFNQFLQGIEKEKIKGLCYKNHIVSPDFDLDFSLYNWKTCNNQKHYADQVILTSVGCPYSCRFCSTKSIWNNKIFYRDLESIFNEIIQKKLRKVQFRDDNFLLNKKRFKKICLFMKKKKIKWHCQARVDSLTEDIIELMVQSGCQSVSCGFESFDDSTLKYVNKKHTTKQIEDVIYLLEKHKLFYTGGFIIGFPNEGKKEIRNTLNFIKRVQKNKYNQIPSESAIFLGFPGSELYSEIVKEDLIEYNWCNGELLFPRTKKLSRKEVENFTV